MEPYKKGQNLLEGFVWPIDTGRLMGDAVSGWPCILTTLPLALQLRQNARPLRLRARRYTHLINKSLQNFKNHDEIS